MTPGKAKNKKKYEYILFLAEQRKFANKMSFNENAKKREQTFYPYCLLVFPSSLSASVVSVRLLLYADDFEVSLPCSRLRLAGIFPVF